MEAFLLQHYENALGTIFYGAIIVFAIAEFILPWRAARLPLITRWSTNIGMGVVQALLGRVLLPIGLFKLSILADTQGWGLFHLLGLPLLLALPLGVLVLDLVKYLEHRLLHMVPILWRAHVVHHADLEIDFTTGFRHHPIEVIMIAVPSAAAILVFGIPAGAVAIFQILALTISIFTHVNVQLPAPVDRVLRLFIITPEVHVVHHSAHRVETDSNFGLIFIWWDRLFGTYRAAPQEGVTMMQVGVEYFRDPADLRLDKALLLPFRVPSETQQPVPDRVA
ncbi:MAG: sterol desaturase family protein [Alphaproteobacteria bacterium]